MPLGLPHEWESAKPDSIRTVERILSGFLRFTPRWFSRLEGLSIFPPRQIPDQPFQEDPCHVATRVWQQAQCRFCPLWASSQLASFFFSSVILFCDTVRDTGAGKFWVRGEAAVGCDEGRKFQRVWGKLARALRHAITQEFCLSFRVIYFFFLFFLFFMFWQRPPWVRSVHSVFNKSLSHTNMTDNSFSSFRINSVTDISVRSTLQFASDIKTSHQYFTIIQKALLGQLTFPRGLIPVSFEEKNKIPCNQCPHPYKGNRDISSQTGQERESF